LENLIVADAGDVARHGILASKKDALIAAKNAVRLQAPFCRKLDALFAMKM
jgi:hypothetical protein